MISSVPARQYDWVHKEDVARLPSISTTRTSTPSTQLSRRCNLVGALSLVTRWPRLARVHVVAAGIASGRSRPALVVYDRARTLLRARS